jgi:hypothetical protein
VLYWHPQNFAFPNSITFVQNQVTPRAPRVMAPSPAVQRAGDVVGGSTVSASHEFGVGARNALHVSGIGAFHAFMPYRKQSARAGLANRAGSIDNMFNCVPFFFPGANHAPKQDKG